MGTICPVRTRGEMVAREGIPRHADFQSFFGFLRSIKHLQRLAGPFPGSPRHDPGTLNLMRYPPAADS
jgi:hypothetical protein